MKNFIISIANTFKILVISAIISSYFYIAGFAEGNIFENKIIKKSYENFYEYIDNLSFIDSHSNDFEVIIMSYLLLSIILVYFLFYKLFKKKALVPGYVYLANIFFALAILIFIVYWETDFLKNEISYIEFVLISYSFFILVFPLNIIFITKVASIKKFWQLFILIFIPILSLAFIYNSLKPFLESNKIIWIKTNNKEYTLKPDEVLNITLTSEMKFWWVGLEKWVDLNEFKRLTNLYIIR